MQIMLLKLSRTFFPKYYLRQTRTFSSTNYDEVDEYSDSEKSNNADKKKPKKPPYKSRAKKIIDYFNNEPHLNEVLGLIPSKYFFTKRRLKLQHLYLTDKTIAKDAALHIMPFLLRNTKKQIVCETNAGLGLITAELLQHKVELVRMYETCPEFRNVIKGLYTEYLCKIELFVRDIYSLTMLAIKDKYDNEGRVDQLLQGVPKRDWKDDPVMTIIGPMSNLNFINYLLKMLALQQGITCLGRIQLFALMKPLDYFKLTATVGTSLRFYQIISILFQLFFDYQLITKYPRKSFLPWETTPSLRIRKTQEVIEDMEYIYLVQMNLKKDLPVEPEYLLHLFYFIKQGFRRGRTLVIPTVEKWLPGIGANLIVPRTKYRNNCYPNMTIYTEFCLLNATQILQVFLEMIEHPEFENSPFIGLVQTHLIKTETIDSDLIDSKNTFNK